MALGSRCEDRCLQWGVQAGGTTHLAHNAPVPVAQQKIRTLRPRHLHRQRRATRASGVRCCALQAGQWGRSAAAAGGGLTFMSKWTMPLECRYSMPCTHSAIAQRTTTHVALTCPAHLISLLRGRRHIQFLLTLHTFCYCSEDDDTPSSDMPCTQQEPDPDEAALWRLLAPGRACCRLSGCTVQLQRQGTNVRHREAKAVDLGARQACWRRGETQRRRARARCGPTLAASRAMSRRVTGCCTASAFRDSAERRLPRLMNSVTMAGGRTCHRTGRPLQRSRMEPPGIVRECTSSPAVVVGVGAADCSRGTYQSSKSAATQSDSVLSCGPHTVI